MSLRLTKCEKENTRNPNPETVLKTVSWQSANTNTGRCKPLQDKSALFQQEDMQMLQEDSISILIKIVNT